MRIFIVADIEGVAGVTHPEQTRPGSGEYERARLLMTREVNAAVQGALDGGAQDIWVADAHGAYRNLLIEHLHPEARFISGKPRLDGMLGGLAEHGPWDGLFLVGCHARAGAAGVLAHTINSAAFALITVDGKAVGETFLNSAMAGEMGIAVRLVSGDDCLTREVAPFLTGVETVTVKQALGNRAAAHLPLEAVHAALRDAAEQAVQRDASPHVVQGPLWVEITTVQPVQADAFALLPCMQRLTPSAVGFEARTPGEALRLLNACSLMAAGL